MPRAGFCARPFPGHTRAARSGAESPDRHDHGEPALALGRRRTRSRRVPHRPRVRRAHGKVQDPLQFPARISTGNGFSATFDRLQRNPPLIRFSSDGYYVHSDTKVAVTTSSDLRDVLKIRLRAARACAQGGKVLEGARLYLQSSVPEDALEV